MSVSEQRYQAVLAVISEGETVTDVAARFGVSRQTMHTWLAKYEAGGLFCRGDEWGLNRWRWTARPQGDNVQLIKSLWASVQGDPVLMRRVNGWLTIFWIIMIPVSFAMGWIHSVAYVSALSLWALVSGHWSAWQAARVEVEQVRAYEEATERPVEDRVVSAVIERTTLEPLDEGRLTT